MSEDRDETGSLPPAMSRVRRVRRSRWPLLVALLLLLALLAGSVVSLIRSRTGHEPWRIDYPGVTWTRGTDAGTKEGKRYLQAEVRFDQEIVSANDLEMFLAEVVTQTRDTYYYYHIKALNKRGVHVLDAVADRTGLHSISIPERYSDQ